MTVGRGLETGTKKGKCREKEVLAQNNCVASLWLLSFCGQSRLLLTSESLSTRLKKSTARLSHLQTQRGSRKGQDGDSTKI